MLISLRSKKTAGIHDKYYTEPAESPAWKRHELRRRGQRPVAHATTRPFRGGRIVENLFVPESFRKEGLATQLLANIEKDADTELWILPDPYADRPVEKEKLKKFYRKMGFAPTPYGDYMHKAAKTLEEMLESGI